MSRYDVNENLCFQPLSSMPSARPNDVKSVNNDESEDDEDDDYMNFSPLYSPSMRILCGNNPSAKQSKPSRPATANPAKRSSSVISLRRSRMTKSSMNLTKCRPNVQV